MRAIFIATLQTKLHNKLHNKSTSQLDLKLQQVASDFRKSQQLVEQLNVQLDSLEFAAWVEALRVQQLDMQLGCHSGNALQLALQLAAGGRSHTRM